MAVECEVNDLRDLDDGVLNTHVAVVQLMDNVAHSVLTSEDTIIPCRKDSRGTCHVDGDLMLAPPELLSPFMRNCLPIFSMLTESLKLVLVPMPGA
jgi:hypothetical protein